MKNQIIESRKKEIKNVGNKIKNTSTNEVENILNELKNAGIEISTGSVKVANKSTINSQGGY